ncbi:MAG: FMN-binding protein, partial [Bacteroides sp.]
DTSLSEGSIGTELLSLNWGTACLIVAVLLGISYVLRRIFRKKWMPVHRILTVCMIALVAVHVIDTGIQLPSRIFKTSSRNSQSVSESNLNNYTSFSGAQLADGVYEGSADGFESTIKVSVTVKNGTVTNIEILEENDTPDFFERAKRIISDIIDKQSLNVDAVSGATYSSIGILNAVNNALEGAVTDGSLENNNTELPSSDRKHGNFNKKNEPGNLGGGNKRHTQ